MQLDSIQNNDKITGEMVGYIPLRYHNNVISYPTRDGCERFYIGRDYNAIPTVITSHKEERYYDGYHCFLYKHDAFKYIVDTYGDNASTSLRVYFCNLKPPYTHGYINGSEAIVSSSIKILYDTQFYATKEIFIQMLEKFMNENAHTLIGEGTFPDQLGINMENWVCAELAKKFLEINKPWKSL